MLNLLLANRPDTKTGIKIGVKIVWRKATRSPIKTTKKDIQSIAIEEEQEPKNGLIYTKNLLHAKIVVMRSGIC
jgi:hypothetical protein